MTNHPLTRWLKKWLPEALSRRSRRAKLARNRPSRYVPQFELLDGRQMLAGLVVTNASDPAMLTSGTLRYEINQANTDAAAGQSDTITFDIAAMGTSTVSLSSPGNFSGQILLELTAGTGVTTIDGSQVTVMGAPPGVVLKIDSGATAVISGLTITDGDGQGGAICNDGTLTLSNCTLSGNSSSGSSGGGIYNAGTLSLSDSTVSGNRSVFGGGIYNSGTMTAASSTIADNNVFNNMFASHGGGIYNTGTMSLSNCTVSGNATNSGSSGGGIYNPGTLALVNTVVAGNSGSANPDLVGSYTDNGGNLVGGNPQLNSLGFNGGPTQTMSEQNGSPLEEAGVAVTTVNTASGVNGTTTSIPVASAAAVAVTPGDYLITVDSEQMLVTGVDTTNNTLTVIRGYDGTPASSHNNGAGIYFSTDQRGYATSTTTPDIGAFQQTGSAPGTPTVTSVSPASGTITGGTSVTITGTNLGSVTSVLFGGLPATIVSDSPTQVVVTTPAESAGTVDTTVTTVGWDTSATSSSDQYTYNASVVASQLVVSVSPASLTAGQATSVTITAEDSFGNVVSSFSDTVTLSDSLGGATFGAVSFSGGVATVTATLDKAGTQTLTATDTATSTRVTAGTTSPISVTPAAAAKLAVGAPASAVVGQTTNVTITVEDRFNNPVSGFSDTVTLTDSLGSATFSGVSFASGAATVTATLSQTGAQTITATDTTNGMVSSGTSNSITVTPPPVPPVGSEFQVNSYTTNNQLNPKVATDAAGDFVIVWQSYYRNGKFESSSIFAQRYTTAGAPQGGEFQVNTYTNGSQTSPQIAMDSAGDFVVAWDGESADGSGYGIYAQRFNASGTAQGSEFRVNMNTAAQFSAPTVAMDSAGDFVVGWTATYGNSETNIYAQRYNAAGAPQGGEFRGNSNTVGNESPSAAMDSAGDFVIAWVNTSFHPNVVEAQRYNAAGMRRGNEFSVGSSNPLNQQLPAVAIDSAGDFVVTWQIYGDGIYGIYGQRYNASGTAQGSQFQVNTYTANVESPSVSIDSAGDFVVTWQNYYEDGSEAGVYAQQYNASGATQGTEFLVNTYATGNQKFPSIAMDSQGDFVIAWQSNYEDGYGYGIYAQRYANALPASQLVVGATPTMLSAGQTTSVTITAEDQFNNIITGFSDSVTLSDSLGFADFTPASFTNGVATVTATLDAGGSQTITAVDATAGAIGTSGSISVTPVVVATATDSSTVLNIELGTGAQVGIVSLGSSYELTLASGDWSVSTGDANVSGNGTPVLTVSGPAIGQFSDGIDISDTESVGGDEIIFTGSNAYFYNSFKIALTHAEASAALVFAGNTLFPNTAGLSATVNGPINVLAGALLESTSGNITLATGDTLSIASGADVTTTGAITLRGSNVSIDTSSDPALVGAKILPASFTTFPVAVLSSSSMTAGNSNVIAYDPIGDYGLYEASYSGSSVSEFAPGATTATTILTDGIQSPGALLFDSSGDLFVGNASGGVTEFAPGGTAPIATFDTPAGLGNIFSLAMDSSGDLFAADALNNVIAEFNPISGTAPIAIINDASLANPIALAFDSSGDLFVANSGNGTVSEFAPNTTTPFLTLSGFSFGSANQDHGALTFDPSGNLYVADFNNNLVDVFAPGATTAFETLTGLSEPEALTFDPHGDYGLFVANYGYGFDTVSVFAPGATTASFTINNSVSSAQSLAFDPLGDLFVSASNYSYYTYTDVSEVVVFRPTPVTTIPEAASVAIQSSDESDPIQIGTTTNTISSGIYLTNAELRQIYTVTGGTVTIGDAEQTGNITFTNTTPAQSAGTTLDAVQDTTGPGQVILSDNSQAGPALSNSGPINITAGTGGIVSLDQNDGTADIATTGANVTLLTAGPVGSAADRIQLADRSHAGDNSVVTVGSTSLEASSVYLAGLKGATSGMPTLMLGNVLVNSQQTTSNVQPDTHTSTNTIDITAEGNLIVTSNSTIEDFGGGDLLLGADLTEDEQGNHGPGSLTIDSGVTVTTTGQITLRGTDVVISTPQHPVTTGVAVAYGPTASAVISIDTRYPDAIAFDSAGDMFVAVTGGSVLEFAPGQTTPLAVFSDPSLQNAGAMAFDSSGDLFVANSVITIYQGLRYFGGTTVAEFKPGSGITTAVAVLTDPSILDPTALAFDSSGDLFVADYRTNKITEFAPGKTTAMAVLSDSSLKGPVGLAFDSSGNLFVVDGITDQVTEFGVGKTTATAVLTGPAFPSNQTPIATAIAIDKQDDVFMANFTFGNTDDVTEFAAGSAVPTAELNGVSTPSALAFDAKGNLYVTQQGDNPPLGTMVAEFVRGATTPSLVLTDPSLQNPTALAFDTSGDLFVGTFGTSVMTEFTPSLFASGGNSSNGAASLGGAPNSGLPIPSKVTIQSSDEGNAMQIGTTTNSLGTGIYLTDDELAQIYTTATGSITFGDTSQTGNITFTAATPATISGAAVDVVQDTDGAGAIILDDASGTGLGLSGNGGAVTFTAGTGGVQSKLFATGTPLATDEFTASGNALKLSLGFAPVIGTQLTVVNNTASPSGSNPINGTFSNLAQNATVTLTYNSATYYFQANYQGGDGNDLVLTNVAGPATQLQFTIEPPATVIAGTGFSFTVAVEDANGAVETGFSGNVTVALANNPAAGTLGGTLIASVSNGVAVFSGLTLNNPGIGYTLKATGGMLTAATSNSITVVAAQTLQMLLINSPNVNFTTQYQSGGVLAENSTGVVINDTTTLTGATIQIVHLFDGTNESLSGSMNVSGLTSSYNAATGVLTIIGSASVATYESVLESIKYTDIAANPSPKTRVIDFTVTDALGVRSNLAVASIGFGNNNYQETAGPGSTQSPNVSAVNPTIDIDPYVTVNAQSVTSATVVISSGFVSSTEDVLGLSPDFQQNFHITLSQPVPGEVVLTGNSQTTPTQYQLELAAITYTDTSHYFPAGDLQKTFTFLVNGDSGSSVADIKIYNIVPVNTNPTVTTTSGPLSYTILSGAQLVDPGVTVTDPDPLSVTSATVSITSGFTTGQDTLSETAALPANVSVSYSASTGVLTFTGSASLAQYQTLLAGVAYTNSGLSVNPRTISFVVSTGSLSSNVAGNNRFTKVIDFSPTSVLRFDFNNGSASSAPGFLAVGPSHSWSLSNGYGFSDAVTNFAPFTASAVENIAGISNTYAPMYEDGIISPTNSPQDFTVSTTVGTNYDLRVYVGNPNTSLNNIQITVYTGSLTNLQQTQLAQVSGISTTAGGSNAFKAVEIDGLIAGGVTSAAGSEITVVIRSTSGSLYTEGLDFALHGDLPAIAHQDPAGGIAPAGSPAVSALTMQELQPVVCQAIANWVAAGITPAQAAVLESAQLAITNLEGQGALALTGSDRIQIDATADGYGWFINPNLTDQPTAGKMDLLTVVTHELGHILGLGDVSASQLPNDLMDTTLPTGTRRLPSAADMMALAMTSPPAAAAPATLASQPLIYLATEETQLLDSATSTEALADETAPSFIQPDAHDKFFTLLG